MDLVKEIDGKLYRLSMDPSGIDISGNDNKIILDGVSGRVGIGNNIILDGASGRVGIGTTDPSAKLEVNGDISITNLTNYATLTTTDTFVNNLLFRHDTNPRYGGYTVNTTAKISSVMPPYTIDTKSGRTDLAFFTATGWTDLMNLSEKMRITSNGNVGIGTTDPKASLHVDNDFHIAANSSSWNTTAGKGIFMRYCDYYNPGGYIQCIDRAASGSPRYPLHFSASKYSFDEGNVGIGTTQPQATLDVNGDITASGTAHFIHSVQIGAESNWHYNDGVARHPLDVRDGWVSTAYDEFILDNPDGLPQISEQTPSAAIGWWFGTKYSGATGLGHWRAAGSQNHSYGSDNRAGVSMMSYDVTSYVNADNDRIGGMFNFSLLSYSGGPKVGIYCQHNLLLGPGGNLMVFSDERIKKDIEDVPDALALDICLNLETKMYNYKCPKKSKPHKVIGFIAQSVAKVLPGAVSLSKEFIADEIRIIEEPQWNGNLLTIADLDLSGNYTGVCRFFVSNDEEQHGKNEKEMELKVINGNQFEFDKVYKNVFFYGKEVSDLHNIDKAQIFALHHSAIQELDRKHTRDVESKEEKIASLEVRIESVEMLLLTVLNKQEEIIAKNAELENKITNIKNKQITSSQSDNETSNNITLL